jgi:hypothetical protein
LKSSRPMLVTLRIPTALHLFPNPDSFLITGNRA